MTTWTVPARVVRVIDADTIVCDLDLGWGVWRHSQHVRLLGIDAPELSTPEGKSAKAWLEGHLHVGDYVAVISEKLDSFGRVLGWVHLYGDPSANLSNILIEVGHAVPRSGK